MVALSVAANLFYQLHADHFRCEQVIRTNSIRSKTSAERQAQMAGCEARCLTIVSGVIRDGIAQGDLELPEDMTPEEITFGLWALTHGTHLIMASDIPLAERGLGDPLRALARNGEAFLDGYAWRPLSSEWNYQETVERVAAEVFPDEFRQLEGS